MNEIGFQERGPPCRGRRPVHPRIERLLSMEKVTFGLRYATPSQPGRVDLATYRYDPDLQIGVVEEGGVTLPALRHSTGTTSTNTASQDNSNGADSDSDQTED
jgi:putative ATP-grasp target RiPP